MIMAKKWQVRQRALALLVVFQLPAVGTHPLWNSRAAPVQRKFNQASIFVCFLVVAFLRSAVDSAHVVAGWKFAEDDHLLKT